MAALHGKGGTANIGGALTGIKNWAITPTTETHDSTSMSSGGKRQRTVGIDDWTGSFETVDFPGLTLTGTQALATFTTPSNSYVGTVIVTEDPVTVPHDDLITWAVSFEGHGALTKS